MQGNVSVGRAPAGDLLGSCLVEGDGVALALARRTRRKALLVSVGLQVALLAALVLLPMWVAGERVEPYHVKIVPPYPGSPRADTRTGQPPSGSRPTSTVHRPEVPIYQPPHIPTGVANTGGSEERRDLTGTGPGAGWGIPNGVMPPVGDAPPGWIPPTLPVVPPPVERPRPRAVISEPVQQALLIHRVEPVYPALARQIRLEGTVRLRAIIGRDGVVNSLELLSGHPILARAALNAVSQWRYRPTLLNGQPVEVETCVTVIFQLQR